MRHAILSALAYVGIVGALHLAFGSWHDPLMLLLPLAAAVPVGAACWWLFLRRP